MPRGVYPHPPQCGFQKGHKSFLTAETLKAIGQKVSKSLQGRCASENNAWIDGPTLHKGYYWVWAPDNPRAYNYKRMKRCDYLVEQYLGRPLAKGEMLHHIDCDRTNDSLDNLYLCSSHSEHRKIHWRQKKGEKIVSNICGLAI